MKVKKGESDNDFNQLEVRGALLFVTRESVRGTDRFIDVD